VRAFQSVTPAKAGVQEACEEVDSRFRGNDKGRGNDNGRGDDNPLCHCERSEAISTRLKEGHCHDLSALATTASTEHRVITLTRGRFTIVDAEDYDRLAEHKWYVSDNRGLFYAQRQQNGRTIRMHRVILNIPPGLLCDHKNHNTLDNRRCNLRICTQAQNHYNQLPRDGGTSRYKGVHWHKDHRRWEAQIQHKGRNIHIGYYDYEADAAIAYDDMAIELFGEFACLNFNYRPEIRLWLQTTYLFAPTKNNLATHPQPGPPVNSHLPVVRLAATPVVAVTATQKTEDRGSPAGTSGPLPGCPCHLPVTI